MATAHALIEIKQNSQNISGNTSNVTANFYAVLDSGYVYSGYATYPKLTLDGTTETKTLASYNLTSSNPKVFLGSITKNITHNADGTKTISASLSWNPDNDYLSTVTGSTTKALTTIPRYATSNQSLSSKTETTITMNWSSDSTIDYIWYSTDWGTNWVAVGSVNAKSGSYTINKNTNTGGNLTANTTYNVITRVRRKESQLTTNSSKLSVTTHDYPYCTESPNFVIGDFVTLKFYNPLGRTFNFYIIGNGTQIDATYTCSSTSYTGVNSTTTSVPYLYATIPLSQSATYKVKVVYGSSEKIRDNGNTYQIRGTEIPTINAFDYIDNNADTVAITGNNQHIVQNKSKVMVRFHDATANNGARGISYYDIYLNGKKTHQASAGSYNLGTVDSEKDVDLTLIATDSRGLTASKTIKVTMLAHSDPTAIVTLQRLNNYEDETYLTVDGSISSVNQKNTMTIQYRYKVSGGSYGSFVTIGDKVKRTLSLNKENIYIFNVIVTDAFGSKIDQEYTLNKGVFPLFIDTEKNSVGVNCFPHNNNSLEVDGLISANSMKCKNLLYTPYTEDNKLTITATMDDHTVTTGYYCYLEKGKKYTFSSKTDGNWGGGNGTDTVEVFLLKDKAYDTYLSIVGNPKTFTPTATGNYFLRVDVNKKGTTHSFWDFQIEEGSVATEYTEAKQFEYQEQYIQWEHQVGYWFDGKPLYRKIISLGASHFGTEAITTGKNVNIPHNTPNIKDIVKIEDIWCTNNQYRKFPSNYYGNAGWDGQYYCTNTEICFELGSAIYNRLISATTFFYIVLYYTKTTD